MLRFTSPTLTIEALLGGLTPPAIDVVGLTAESIQRDYAAGRYSAVELTCAFLARIARLEPLLNAFIVLNDRVLDEAAAVDRAMASGSAGGPLRGVPIVAKDNMNMVGFRTTAGYAGFAGDGRVVDPVLGTCNGLDLLPTRDATLLARLKAAGAIILGKSNLPDFGLNGLRANSSLNGDTLSAYRPTFAPGASSTGTGSAVAASMAVMGLGTDTAGSILFPASAQSLVGIKPSFGLVPIDGVFPGLSSHHDVAGPMAKTVRDAAVMLDAIAGPTPADPRTRAAAGSVAADPARSYLDGLARGALRGKRLGVHEPGQWAGDLHPEIAAHYQSVVETAARLGATIVPTVFADTDWKASWERRTSFTKVNSYLAGVDAFLAGLGGAAPASRAAFAERAGFPFPLGNRAPFTALLADPAINVAFDDPRMLAVIAEADLLAARYAAILTAKGIDALLLPRSVAPLPDLSGDSFAYLGEQVAGTEVNEMGLPVVTLPTGYQSDGRPLAVDLVGRARFTEHELLPMAYDLEQATNARLEPAL